jgi:hypothetical protein
MERGSVFRQAGLSVIFARLGRYEGTCSQVSQAVFTLQTLQ